jgi:hypothetical protein
MAIKLSSPNEVLKVISRIDDSLTEDLTADEWASYLENYDETLLRFKAGMEPTRFVIKKTLSYAAQQSVANSQVGMTEDGKPQIKIGFILDEVRCALTAIENPASTPEDQRIIFVKEIDGMASKELIAMLNDAGIVQELYQARQNKSAHQKK